MGLTQSCGSPCNNDEKRGDSFMEEKKRQDAMNEALDKFYIQQKELEYLSRLTRLEPEVLQKLYDRFLHISQSKINDGVIDAEEFSQALGMTNNILSQRMFVLFNVTKTAGMNFREFAMATAVLSEKADIQEKIRFSFDLYDLNKDNRIDGQELAIMLRAALAENNIQLTDEQIEQICANTLKESDINNNGFIEFEEYRTLVEANPRLLSPFTINLAELLRAFDNRHKVDIAIEDPLTSYKRPLEAMKPPHKRTQDTARSVESEDALTAREVHELRADDFGENQGDMISPASHKLARVTSRPQDDPPPPVADASEAGKWPGEETGTSPRPLALVTAGGEGESKEKEKKKKKKQIKKLERHDSSDRVGAGGPFACLGKQPQPESVVTVVDVDSMFT